MKAIKKTDCTLGTRNQFITCTEEQLFSFFLQSILLINQAEMVAVNCKSDCQGEFLWIP